MENFECLVAWLSSLYLQPRAACKELQPQGKFEGTKSVSICRKIGTGLQAASALVSYSCVFEQDR